MATPLASPLAVEIIPFGQHLRQSVTELWEAVFRSADRRVFLRDIDIAIRHNPELFCVAVEGEQLIGTCLGTTDGHRAWIYYLSVTFNKRRQGVATALLNHAESQFRERKITQIGLHVHTRSYAAQMFYRKRGYFQEEVQCMGKRIG